MAGLGHTDKTVQLMALQDRRPRGHFKDFACVYVRACVCVPLEYIKLCLSHVNEIMHDVCVCVCATSVCS